MRGFELSTEPVLLYLLPEAGLGTDPFTIDGAATELTTDGIRSDVNGVRYFVPVRHIARITQVQPAPGPPPTIPTVPTPVTPPPGE